MARDHRSIVDEPVDLGLRGKSAESDEQERQESLAGRIRHVRQPTRCRNGQARTDSKPVRMNSRDHDAPRPFFLPHPREYGSILIFRPRSGWNSPNRIPKFRSQSIPRKTLFQPHLNSSFKFHVCPFAVTTSSSRTLASFSRRARCYFLSDGSLGSTIHIRSERRRPPPSDAVTHGSARPDNGKLRSISADIQSRPHRVWAIPLPEQRA